MIHSLVRMVEIAAVVGAVASCCYYALCLWSAASFLHRARVADKTVPRTPAVSVLKPLKGVDPEMFESFRSHCLQDYPEYEIIFGISDPNDPAAASVRQLQGEFPHKKIQLVVCPEILGTNVKVSNLVQMLRAASHEYLLVNDSDIRVDRDYLLRVLAPLHDEKTGMVTCLYRGVPAATIGSRLESLGISTDFCAGVLAARQLEGGIRFGLGSTLAFRRTDLDRIGGFEVLLDYLADDYELGKRIADRGLRVHLSEVVVETHLPAYSISAFLSHQLRWARGVRDARRGGYLGLVFTFGLLWSSLAAIAASGSRWAWGLLVLTAALRLATAMSVGRTVLHDRYLVRNLWLLPLRDLIAVGIWVASFFGHSVTWRGDRFELRKGQLVRGA